MIHFTIIPKKVLVVAQAFHGISHLLAPLREAGCWVELATTSQEAVGRAAAIHPEIVVIEDRLENVHVVELTLQIRAAVSRDRPPTFIMALPGELSESPVAPMEDAPRRGHPLARSALVNRIAGLMAAPSSDVDTKPLERVACRGLCLDRIHHRAWLGDRSLDFTPTEFKLVWELLSRPGCALTRLDLSKACKGSIAAAQTRTIDAHIKSIRRKLKDSAPLIETVHGIGYRFQEAEW